MGRRHSQPDPREGSSSQPTWEKIERKDESLNFLIKRCIEDKEILQKEDLQYDHEYFDNLKKKWEEHARSHEFLLACFGCKYSYIHNESLKEDFNKYKNFMDICSNEIFQNLEKRDLNNTDMWINNFINNSKAFDNYLKDQGWLGDTPIERFQRTFKTKIIENPEYKGMFLITSEDEIGKGSYNNVIDVNKGEIRGISNFKRHTDDWYFSEVVYTQLQLALQKAGKKISQFDLKSWFGDNVINGKTKSIAEHFLPDGKIEQTFKAGSKEFAAIAQTATAKSKFYLLAQHPEAFGNREVTSITVKRVFEKYGRKLDKEEIDISYAIGERLPEVDKIAEQKDKQHGESSITHEEA